MVKDEQANPSVIYKDGKTTFPQSLNIGKKDKKGCTIPEPKDLNLSVRWAGRIMGSDNNDSKGDLYRWGATNSTYKFQSSNPDAPNYISRSACLAIYGGAGRKNDISGTVMMLLIAYGATHGECRH